MNEQKITSQTIPMTYAEMFEDHKAAVVKYICDNDRFYYTENTQYDN